MAMNREDIILEQMTKIKNIKKYIEFSNNKDFLYIKEKCELIIYQIIEKTEKELKELKKVEEYLKKSIKKVDTEYLKEELKKELEELKYKINRSVIKI